MTDGVTPSTEDQIIHAETHIERTFSGYPDKARLQRAMSSSGWKKELWALADRLGFDPSDVLQWFRHELYGKFLGFDCPDLTGLVVPAYRRGFNNVLPIVAVHGQYPNEAVFQAIKRQLGSKGLGAWKWTDGVLDEAIAHNDRDPLKGAYAVRTRGRVEADKELRDLSANVLAERQIPTETVYEYQIEFAAYYARTGKFLDPKDTSTLLAGSRTVDGDVPNGDWSPDDRKFCLGYWCSPSSSYDGLRGRQVEVSI
ncbi:MAG TPA: hypothetical protein VMQ44_02635 [Candidatus Saccharimonadales bacterium]|nr:hypothetical protein [Candidatus Saccharimonadales bacterium]